MARYNEILAGRINRGLTKLLGMKGEAPAPQIASEITPAMILPLGNEYRYLDSWYRYAAVANIPAVAAQQGLMRIGVPNNANVIAVIERLTIWGVLSNTTSQLSNGVNGFVPLATVQPSGSLDGRQVVGQASTVVSFATGVAALGNVIMQLTSPINMFAEYVRGPGDEIVITPGRFYDLLCSLANLQAIITVVWRERTLEASEL